MAMTEQQVTRRAKALMEEHGLYWPTWGFRISRHKLHVGTCRYNNRGGGMIAFSKNYLNMEDAEIEDTILHEIAHAKVGYAAGHGPEWKRMARSIGAKPEARVNLKKEARPSWKWTGICPNNPQHHTKRHALTDKGRAMACGRCCLC